MSSHQKTMEKRHAVISPETKWVFNPDTNKEQLFVISPITSSMVDSDFYRKNIEGVCVELIQNHTQQSHYNLFVFDSVISEENAENFLFFLREGAKKSQSFGYFDQHDNEYWEEIKNESWAFLKARDEWPSTLFGLLENLEFYKKAISNGLPTILLGDGDMDGWMSMIAAAFQGREVFLSEAEKIKFGNIFPYSDLENWNIGFFESIHRIDSNERFALKPEGKFEDRFNALQSMLNPLARVIDEAFKGAYGYKENKEIFSAVLKIFENPNPDISYEEYDMLKKFQDIYLYGGNVWQKNHRFGTNEKIHRDGKGAKTFDFFEGIYHQKSRIIAREIPSMIDVSLLSTLVKLYANDKIVVSYKLQSEEEKGYQKANIVKVLYDGQRYEGLMNMVRNNLDIIEEDFLHKYHRRFEEDLFKKNQIQYYGLEGRMTFILPSPQNHELVIQFIEILENFFGAK